MTNLIFGITIMAASFTSCATDSNQPKNATANTADTATGMAPAVNPTVANEQTADTAKGKTTSVNEVVSAYLQLKNALAKDNANDAATAGKNVETAIQQIDVSAFSAEQKSVYAGVKDDIREHGEHIGANASKIAHQREHFEMLSNDIYDLAKAVKSDKTLYKDFCPMYNKGKGANWLSETKEINNPYLGRQMPTCGLVKEELK